MSGLPRNPDAMTATAAVEVSGGIQGIEAHVLFSKITAPDSGLASVESQVNRNANGLPLQIVGQPPEIGILWFPLGEHTDISKRHAHPFRPDIRLFMALA